MDRTNAEQALLAEDAFVPTPDWLRANLPVPISGRYEGETTVPPGGRALLELRLDVDLRQDSSPVLNRFSGDLFQVNRLNLPGEAPQAWKVYQESWIVNLPTVRWSPTSIELTGTAEFWKSVHPPTTVSVRVSWDISRGLEPAQVTFSPHGGVPTTYSCTKLSDAFRQLNLEVDVCRSVNQPPLLPSYDTGMHADRPADITRRVLTIESVYREAGVLVSIRSDHTEIDDSERAGKGWTDAELHHAMEVHFSQFAGEWPKWEMWGLLADTYEKPTVGGVMFDAAAIFGGVGKPPERQGFAVFREHPWFRDLTAGSPATPQQAAAMRKYLYTWVHEAGHAFNFLHSWDKNRPDALSWMNYDWRYDARNGATRFWRNFRFRFDDEELIHLRHAHRAAVMMGGDPWASGGQVEGPPGAEYLEAPPGAMSQVEGEVPIEVLIRSQGYFEFMEPVVLELRLRNLLSNLPLTLDTHLNPEYGSVSYYIRRPDGRIVEYAPMMCKVAEPRLQVLEKADNEKVGEDRFSEMVFLSYGKYGFYIDAPGEYWVRALYHGPGDVLIPSNIHRLRVGNPSSPEQDVRAQDFFSYEVGTSLYLYGSRSPHLSRGWEIIEELAERHTDSLLGVRLRAALANSAAKPFYAVRDRKLTLIERGDPERALSLIGPAVELLRTNPRKDLNLTYRNLAVREAELQREAGRADQAQKVLSELSADLAKRGVNPPQVEAIRKLARKAGRATSNRPIRHSRTARDKAGR